MDFNITSIKRRARGFTLVELVMAAGIGSIVLALLSSFILYTGRSFAAMANYVNLDQKSRHALDTMSKEIRQTNRLISHTATSLMFEDWDGGTLTYTYDTSERTLRRSKGGTADARPLLTECDFLQFSIFQRNPVAGGYGYYPTASAATCKLVQLSWVCSRTILGLAVNTESVQSAKVVIRNQ
jgi:prepilin-type N-terminal cleavage/methylation domain-containing protein